MKFSRKKAYITFDLY